MLPNGLYDLMMQMVVENKSLWQIKHNYMKDAEDCPDCMDFWRRMIEDKESHIRELDSLIRTHFSQKVAV